MDTVILVLCVKIFIIRILDVSMGTFRTIVTVKGKKALASLIGFVEVFIWFTIVKEALSTDISSLWVALSYAGGYAVGTYIGTALSSKIIKGNLGVQIILSDQNCEVLKAIRDQGYAVSVTTIKGQNNKEKYMLFIETTNKKFDKLKSLIKNLDSNAFVVVSETKFVLNGYFEK